MSVMEIFSFTCETGSCQNFIKTGLSLSKKSELKIIGFNGGAILKIHCIGFSFIGE